jgi:hypothetical protein
MFFSPTRPPVSGISRRSWVDQEAGGVDDVPPGSRRNRAVLEFLGVSAWTIEIAVRRGKVGPAAAGPAE